MQRLVAAALVLAVAPVTLAQPPQRQDGEWILATEEGEESLPLVKS